MNTYTIMEEGRKSEQNTVYTIESVNAATAVGKVSEETGVPRRNLHFVQPVDLRE